jgi:membrane protein YqaA with SNARE-associated domain
MNDLMSAMLTYAGLFAAAFLAATLLPAQSEAVLLGLMVMDRYPVPLLFPVASAGNILGSSLNYAVGRYLAGSASVQRHVRTSHRDRAEQWYRRYGKWSLLASWVPVIGYPLTVVAGVLREPFLAFVRIVTASKAGRYLVLAAIHEAWFG